MRAQKILKLKQEADERYLKAEVNKELGEEIQLEKLGKFR
jgi:hypothetical protein